MSTEVDHIVVAVDTLDQGRQWCREVLGVEPQTGGRHALMGTHNLLANVSSTAFPDCYLEIIAIDPEAPPPGRPRWFGLDDRSAGPPALAAFVARSRTLDMHRWGLIHMGIDPGPLVALSRGDLHWQMLINAQADMPGAVPMLIQWGAVHPCSRLPLSGLELVDVTLDGMPARVTQLLGLRGVDGQADRPPGLSVRLRTPMGEIELTRPMPQPTTPAA